MINAQPRVIRKGERTIPPGAQTPGIHREQAVADEHVWVGHVRTAPSIFSGWHHHGEYDTYVYVTAGRVRLEFGRRGAEHVDASLEDFIHIPKRAIHREGNPDPTEAEAVLVRVGSGQPLFNVGGPEQ